MWRALTGIMIFFLSSFFINAQVRYDVLVTEFMPDPSPSRGLPSSSFIELKNRSSTDYNLHNWTISNGSARATLKADFVLRADSLVILCPAAAADAYRAYGPVIGVTSFPTLDDGSGEILLTPASGNIVHALRYDKNAYGDDLKASGGYSLEMIDCKIPCEGQRNWTVSRASAGGTPGAENSVAGVYPDESPPALIRSIPGDSANLVLVFDEPLDSLSASLPVNFFISDGLGSPDSSRALPPFFDRVAIHLANAMVPGKIYAVTAHQLTDCQGNEISMLNSCQAGIPEKPEPGDIVFNEILFNPALYGFDYIELYNRSERIINCTDLLLANRDLNGAFRNPATLAAADRLFYPGEYLLFTENTGSIHNTYPAAPRSQLISLSALPSMPDDLGRLVLLTTTSEIIDALDYDHHWHSPLLDNESGVALERIESGQPTNLASNWTSAAADVGYGTPGYRNSESSSTQMGTDMITVDPKIFSPDLDGHDDFCFIRYLMPAAGFMGSITIYEESGRLVRTLVNNQSLSTQGSFRWDGLDDKQHPLPSGIYVIGIQLFNLKGETRFLKKPVVLARKK